MKALVGGMCLVMCLLITSCGPKSLKSPKFKFNCKTCNVEFAKCANCGLAADEHKVLNKGVIHSCGGHGEILSTDDELKAKPNP